MIRWLGSFALATTLVAGLAVGLATTAQAQDEGTRARAREHFTQGVALFEARDFQGALEQFQEAYRIAPHPSVRVNMANCYEALGRPLEALHHFEGFLAESDNPSPQQRREVQAAIRRLQNELGELRLTIAPDGARVTLDNAETRIAPVLEAIMLPVGVHHLEVSMDGFQTDRREISIEGGSTQRVSIRLERGADPAVASTEPDPGTEEPATADPVEDPVEETNAVADPALQDNLTDDDGSGPGWTFTLSTPVIIGGIATVLFAAAMATTGILALDYEAQSDDLAAQYQANPTPQIREDGLAATDTANTLSIVSDAFLIGTIAAGAATVFFVIVDGMESGDDEMATRPGRVAFGGAATHQGGAVSLSGSF